MLRLLKKNKLIIALSLFLMSGVTAVVVSTIAWFKDVSMFSPSNASSSVITNYFDSGKGTQADPLVITRPIHYYNLVYLQETNPTIEAISAQPFADSVLYFQFGKKDIDGNGGTGDENIYKFYNYGDDGTLQYNAQGDETYSPILNMNYYSGTRALPPLGSSTHPFKGHIVGNNLTVSKLHINGEGYSDIGIFGYVAQGATVSNLYFEAPYIDAGKNDCTKTGSSGHDPHPTHTYIGYLAGHVYQANSSFSNVYVNNCELENTTGNQSEMINTYGYFGHVDLPSDIQTESASYSAEAKASDIYNAVNGSYSDASSQSVVSRNTSYTPSGTYGSAVTNSGGTYNMGSYSANNPYSLSTIGYTGGESVNMNIRYKISEGNLNPLDINTTQLDSKPTEEEWKQKDDGSYVYWDSANSKWTYAKVESHSSGEEVTVDYNCFTISYTYNSKNYFLRYDNGNLGCAQIDLNASGDPVTTLGDDYYFVFKKTEGSKGIEEFTSNSNSASVYIYSPAYQKYLYIQEVSSSNEYTPQFIDTAELKFNISGQPTTEISTVLGSYTDALHGESHVWSNRKTSTNPGTTFTIGKPGTRSSVVGSEYNLITSSTGVHAGDVVVIATGFDVGKSHSYSGYYVMTGQNTNNRSAELTTVVNNKLTPIPGAAEFLIGDGSSVVEDSYTFFDQSSTYKEDNSGYLYASSSNSNYMNTNKLSTAGDNAYATINIDANGYAEIRFQGPSTRDYMYFNSNTQGTYPNYSQFSPLFSCYGYKSVGSSLTAIGYDDSHNQFHYPKLFKKTEIHGSDEDYSTCVVRRYTSYAPIEQTVTPYDMFTAPLSADADNPASYSSTPFNVNPDKDVTFIFASSRVSFTGSSETYWAKVTNQSEITSGDKYLIVSEDDGVAFDGSLTALDAGKNKISVTISDSKITENATALIASSFTISTVTGGYSIQSSSGYYIGSSSTGNQLKTSTSYSASTYLNTISIDTNSNATIKAGGTENQTLAYNSVSGDTNERFRYYKTAGGTSNNHYPQLFKLIEAQGSTETYIGDLVGNRYNPNRIDVVGPVSFSSNSYSFTGTSSVTSSPSGKYYTTSFIKSGISILVDKNGSRDLGHLIVDYSGSSEPYLFSTSGSSTTLSTAGARDTDGNAGDNVHSYLLNFNNTNILTLAYCGIDSSGNIVSLNSGSLEKYVLVVGAATSVAFSNVQYNFLKPQGNVGNFGSVDYRTAQYDSNGVITQASLNEQVANSNISIFYDITNENHVFSMTVLYDSSTQTYNLTVETNMDIVITVFLYDNTSKVIVNGDTSHTYMASSNVIPIIVN